MIPGPIITIPSIGCLAVSTSAYEIECYKHSALQTYTDNKVDDQQKKQAEGKDLGLPMEWASLVGEHITAMQCHQNRYTR